MKPTAALLEKQSNFLHNVYKSSKLDSNILSVIPTLIFLSFAFLGLHLHIQEYQTYPGWKGVICRVSCQKLIVTQSFLI